MKYLKLCSLLLCATSTFFASACQQASRHNSTDKKADTGEILQRETALTFVPPDMFTNTGRTYPKIRISSLTEIEKPLMNEIKNNIVFKNMGTGQALDKTIDVTKLAREPGHNQSYRRDITIEPTNWSNAQGNWILLSVKQIPEQVSVDNKSFVKRSDREYGSRFFLESKPFLRDMKLCESNEADNISGVIGFSEPIEVTKEEIQQSVTIAKDGQEVGVVDEGYVSDGVQRKIYITMEQWNGGTLHIDISDAVTSPTDKSLEQKSYSIDFPADLSGCEVRRTEFPQ